MDLWVRSQDRSLLTPINKPISEFCESLFYDGNILGTYKTKERALEVLDEIAKHIDYLHQPNIKFKYIYEMPEE